jgi:hypothetical protein
VQWFSPEPAIEFTDDEVIIIKVPFTCFSIHWTVTPEKKIFQTLHSGFMEMEQESNCNHKFVFSHNKSIFFSQK